MSNSIVIPFIGIPPAVFQSPYSNPLVGPGSFSLVQSNYQRVPFNSKNGQVSIAVSNVAQLGDTIVVYDTGGFAQVNACTMSDPLGHMWQDPQGQGLVLVASYAIQQSGGSTTWTLTFDSVQNATFWAVTSS